MNRRIAGAVALGVFGVTVLLGLCVWQIERLQWKEGLIAELEARFHAQPVAVPAHPDPKRDALLRVKAEGRIGGREIHMLTSNIDYGPGFRIIAPMTLTDGRRILVDLGYVPEEMKNTPRPPVTGEVIGALYWPNEKDMWTPDPDLGANIWFARELKPMAETLNTLPLMIVAEKTPMHPWPKPLRIGINLPNHHLQYAFTWFTLAVVWGWMTLLLIRSERRKQPGDRGGD